MCRIVLSHLPRIIALILVTSPAAAVEWPLGEGTKVRPASVEEGREVLSLSNGYLERMSPLDRAIRMKSGEEVSAEQFVRHITAQVQAWDEAEIAKLGEVWAKLGKQLAGWKLPWPDTILVVKTTGEEEGGAAYCRGAAIVLPAAIVAGPAERLESLLLHELFHILSSHNRPLRKQLYAIVGFLPCREVELPGDLKLRKLTNPDAPANNYYAPITVDGKERLVVPVLFSELAKYDAAQGKSLFDYVTFRLIVVEVKDTQMAPVLEEGQPVLLDTAKTPGYFDKIGRNTNYIIHPEEVLADNFIYLVEEKKDVKTPAILTEMRKVFAAYIPGEATPDDE